MRILVYSHKIKADIIVHSCHGTKRTFIMYFHSGLRPDSALREKASRAVIWGGERVSESREMPLMPPIHPLTINLSLKFQSERIAKYIYI